jgi:DNA-binding NarL/FixJ family response regulator
MNLNKGSSRNAPGDTPGINGRMLDVMLRLGQGDTVKAIAADMNLSVKTISTYRSRVLERLHLKSNADIVRYCLMQGLA